MDKFLETDKDQIIAKVKSEFTDTRSKALEDEVRTFLTKCLEDGFDINDPRVDKILLSIKQDKKYE